MSDAPTVPAAEPKPKPDATTGNLLDPERFVIRQDHLATGATRKVTISIPVDKPRSTAWIWIPRDTALRRTVVVFSDKGIDQRSSSGWYLLTPEIFAAVGVGRGVKLVELVAYVDRHGNLGLWPVSMPMADGRANGWIDSARTIVSDHAEQWINITSNTNIGANEVKEPITKLPPPASIELTFAQMLTIAFRGRIIDSMDHALLRELRGEFSL